MVAGADLVKVANWLDPVATVLVGAAILIYVRRVIQPRLDAVEVTVSDREDRLDDHELNAQERALIIDDNAERVDQVEEVQTRLKKRVRRLEQSFAAHHNSPPRDFRRGGDGSTRDDPADGGDQQTQDGDADADDPGPDGDDPDVGADAADAATRRLRSRIDRIRDGVTSSQRSNSRRMGRTPRPRGDD